MKGTDEGVFAPRGRPGREILLARCHAADVIRVLGPRIGETRRRRIDEAVSHRTFRVVAALEGVADPHNAAAVVRTADAFGVQTVHVIETGARFLSSRRVTQGAHKWVDIQRWPSARDFVAAMRREERLVLAASAGGESSLDRMPRDRRLALVFGNESTGLSAGMLSLSDGTFRVPLYGFVESLNVSVAAAICLHALRAGGEGDLEPEEAEILRARFYLRAVRAGADIVEREIGGAPRARP